MWMVASLKPDRVKPMSCKADTCRNLAWCLALLRYGEDWLVQCQVNVTEWEIGSWCWWSPLLVEQHLSHHEGQYWSWYNLWCCVDVKPKQPSQINPGKRPHITYITCYNTYINHHIITLTIQASNNTLHIATLTKQSLPSYKMHNAPIPPWYLKRNTSHNVKITK